MISGNNADWERREAENGPGSGFGKLQETITFSARPEEFAKEQLDLVLQDFFIHPPVNSLPTNGTLATSIRRRTRGLRFTCIEWNNRLEVKDLDSLKGSFSKLMLNFIWWINRKDRFGKNLLKAGFSAWTISVSSQSGRICEGLESRGRLLAPLSNFSWTTAAHALALLPLYWTGLFRA